MIDGGAGQGFADLSKLLELMGWTGRGTLFAALRRARDAGGDIRVCGARRIVAKVFEIIRSRTLVALGAPPSQPVGP